MNKLVINLVLYFLFSFHGLAADTLLRETVKTLSSKEFEGRRPGTPGNEKATNFLINKIKSFGIKDIKEFPNFKQEFTVFTRMSKNGANDFKVNSISEDPKFEPISFSLSGDLTNKEIAFVGFGISIPETDPKLKYDDYKNIDVKGKIVVVLTGDPGIGNQKSLFRDTKYFSYRSVHYKLNNAIIHGAKGVIFIRDPLSLDDPTNSPDLFFNAEEGGGSRISIIAGNIKHTWFDKLLKKFSTNTLKLQRTISSTQKTSSFNLINETAKLSVHLTKETGRIANVVAYIPGTDPILKNEIVVLGGHFDHLGYGGASSLEPDPKPKIHFGADDNASGTALSLSLLKTFSSKKNKRSMIFVFFNAEESGLLGSKHFVSSWSRYSANYGNIIAMLNFDMVGRFDKVLTVMGLGSAFEWDTHLKKITQGISSGRNPNMLLPTTFQKTAVDSSDHSSFINEKIPALFFTTGAHGDYHRASDTSDKIRFNEMIKLEYYANKLTTELANGLKLTFNPDALISNGNDGDRGYGARLGCVPEFGQGSGVVGVLCTKASPGSPAEKAGIVSGDILKAIGDIKIKSIYDLAFSLRYYRAGDKLTLQWDRNGNILEAKVTLQAPTRH
jgi:hypothetical protein